MLSIYQAKAKHLQAPDCVNFPRPHHRRGNKEDLLSFTHNWQIGLVCGTVLYDAGSFITALHALNHPTVITLSKPAIHVRL